MNKALQRAVDVMGSQKALADAIGTSQSQIWFWLHESKNGLSPEFVIAVENATGVSRHKLRPDIYPK